MFWYTYYMSDFEHRIPDTPEGMFPDDFDVYTTADAANELLQAGNVLGAADMLVGLPEGLGTVDLPPREVPNFGIDDDVEISQRVDELAKKHGVSRGSIIRNLVRLGLKHSEE